MYSHYEHSKIFKRWCVALIITVFILGIVAGFVFKVEEYSLYSTYSDEHFNWVLALIIWFSEVIPAAILYAVYSHLENQEIQINNLNQIRQFLNDYKLSDTKATHLSDDAKPNFKNLDKADKTWVCSKCGKSNPVGVDRCSSCDFKNM